MGVLESVIALAQRYPKTSAALAFEVGLLASSLIYAARQRRAGHGVLAKIVDVVPLASTSNPRKRRSRKVKPAAAKRKTKPRQARNKSKPAADTAADAAASP
jgi:hypothetical protein